MSRLLFSAAPLSFSKLACLSHCLSSAGCHACATQVAMQGPCSSGFNDRRGSNCYYRWCPNHSDPSLWYLRHQMFCDGRRLWVSQRCLKKSNVMPSRLKIFKMLSIKTSWYWETPIWSTWLNRIPLVMVWDVFQRLEHLQDVLKTSKRCFQNIFPITGGFVMS